jgi:hypothetical protein
MGTIRHAYLVQAHNQPELLKLLIRKLDIEENDIVLHLDAKSPLAYEQFADVPRHASMRCCKRQSVTWGDTLRFDVSLVYYERPLSGHHCYYHLLSGTDLPLRPIRDINTFYENAGGKEFINYEDPTVYSRQYELRIKYKSYFRERCGRDKNAFTVLNKGLWLVQKELHMTNRQTISKDEFVFGSNWFDMTEDCVSYVLRHEGDFARWFENTSNADEVFLQYLVWNSEWRERLWRPLLDNGMEGNMRYINWQGSVNASPRTIDDSLVHEALSSGMMYGRKFDYEGHPDVVKKVLAAI